MKLIYAHTAPVPSLAANAVQVAKMCAAFQAAGVETNLVQSARTGGTVDEIVAHYGLDRRFEARRLIMPPLPGRELLFGALAAGLHGPGREGVIYTRSVSVAAGAAALGQRVALEMHLPASALRGRIARRLARLVASPRFAGMVVISGKLCEDFERRFPVLKGRILVAHDGADRAPEVQSAALAGDFRVGYIGQLYPGKGMEIIAELAPLCPWATFHIVGGAPFDVETWRTRLTGQGNVVFHGHVRHADTSAYIAGMDVVLAPYLRVVRGVGGGEQNLADWMSPLKIFEYMAHARPILASDLEVLREVLHDGDNALLRAPEDIDGWAAALTLLRDDGIFRRRIGSKGHSDFLDRYTWDRRACAIIKVLDAS
jgi:glycosyltransferase involved in cell wall biosynthesis